MPLLFLVELQSSWDWQLSIALLFLAILDYLYQKYDFEKNIRMSKQDIKDEYKNIEGDPLIKSKLKKNKEKLQCDV